MDPLQRSVGRIVLYLNICLGAIGGVMLGFFILAAFPPSIWVFVLVSLMTIGGLVIITKDISRNKTHPNRIAFGYATAGGVGLFLLIHLLSLLG